MGIIKRGEGDLKKIPDKFFEASKER